MSWKLSSGGSAGEKFRASGIDFPRQQWTKVEGEFADVKDPHLHQDFKFQIYSIKKDGVITRFAVGEYVSGYWGYYVEEQSSK